MLITPGMLPHVGVNFHPWTAPGVLHVRRGFYATERTIAALSKEFPQRQGESRKGAGRRRQEVIDLIAVWQRGEPMLLKQIKPFWPPPECGGVWELRATDTPPGARLFGMFPARNIFVATSVVPRDTLGERGSPAWNKAIKFAHDRSVEWFPDAAPIQWDPQQAVSELKLEVICDDF